jgi:N-acetylglucosaminyl-diphospho-decaprenol L-rhamnosyltransferase
VSPELSIIIVNWNAGGLLQRCVETIINSAPQAAYEVLVIDNASEDESLALLQSNQVAASLLRNQRLRIIENSENRGFGSANNQGFALTTTPFVLLLNPDTEVQRGAIDALMTILRSDQRIGACGPKLVNPDGSVQISVFRNPPRFWHTLISQLKLYLVLPSRIRGELLLGDHWDHSRKRPVPMLIGAAILARREMIEAVGGFDEKYGMYSEDNEWCLRITRAGWQLMFEPAAIVLHHSGHSAFKRWSKPEKTRIQHESSYIFQRQVLPRWQLIANQLTNYLVVSAQVGWRRLRGVHLPELNLQREIHRQNLKRSLGLKVTGP